MIYLKNMWRVREYLKSKFFSEKILIKTIGYQSYGRKHGESRFTRFFQNYILPKKFNIDKRIAHYSSLILSGQMKREDAVKKLTEPLYDEIELMNDFKYVSNKLSISENELHQLISSEPLKYNFYKNWDSRYKVLKFVQSVIERLLNKKINKYF